MSNLEGLLGQFHTAILKKDATCAHDAIKGNERISAKRQLDIYIEGYRIRLTGAIRSDYPALLEIVGDHEFNRLAQLFIEQNPPTHFNLDRYPHPFADFVVGHCDDDFAVNVATLEGAIARVFMAEDSEILTSAALSSLSPEEFGNTSLKLRTASALLQLDYPAHTYLTDSREGQPPPIPQPKTTHLFLVRHHHEVRRHELSAAQYHILSYLNTDLTVGVALDKAIEESPESLTEIAAGLQAWFSDWAQQGFFQPVRLNCLLG